MGCAGVCVRVCVCMCVGVPVCMCMEQYVPQCATLYYAQCMYASLLEQLCVRFYICPHTHMCNRVSIRMCRCTHLYMSQFLKLWMSKVRSCSPPSQEIENTIQRVPPKNCQVPSVLAIGFIFKRSTRSIAIIGSGYPWVAYLLSPVAP